MSDRPPSPVVPGAPFDRGRTGRRMAVDYAETLLPAILIAAAIHLALAKIIPASGLLSATPTPPARPLRGLTFAADSPIPANLLPASMRPAAPKFVEVNPLAPSAKPDHLRQTGAADQRSAQPVPESVKTGDTPKLNGEARDSTRVSQNIPREFLPETLRPRPGQPVGRALSDVAQKPAARPDPSGKKDPGHPTTPARVEAPGPRLAAKNAADPVTLGTPQADGDTPRPKPRPKASLAGTSGPLGLTMTSANEHGVLANDSVFSRMGEYSSRFYEIIQAAWWAGIERSRMNETGTVVIEFTLHRDGTVSDATIVESSTSERAALLCLDSVIGRAPFDKWPEDMVGMFGEKQAGRLTFHYR